MALTFCGKKSEVGASVSYAHISSLVFKTAFALLLDSLLSLLRLGGKGSSFSWVSGVSSREKWLDLPLIGCYLHLYRLPSLSLMGSIDRSQGWFASFSYCQPLLNIR